MGEAAEQSGLPDCLTAGSDSARRTRSTWRWQPVLVWIAFSRVRAVERRMPSCSAASTSGSPFTTASVSRCSAGAIALNLY